MNVIFIKEVSSTVMNGRNIKLNINKIGHEDSIFEININNDSVKKILNHISNSKESTVIKSRRTFGKYIKTKLEEYHVKKINRSFHKIIKENDFIGYSVIYSNDINKKEKIKRYLQDIFKSYSINEYILNSTVEKNLRKYIDEFKLNTEIKDENIKVLFLANETNSINLSTVEELNNKYKEISIFCKERPRKEFQNKISRINNEYGSCIQVLNKAEKDFREYNIYIFVDKSRIDYAKCKFSKKGLCISFTNKENDRYNEKYVKLESKLKQGFYYSEKIKELYELYGKVTVASAIIN